MRIDRRSIQNFDWVLLGLAALLVGLGLINLLSATHGGVETDSNDTFRRQLLALGVATVATPHSKAVAKTAKVLRMGPPERFMCFCLKFP